MGNVPAPECTQHLQKYKKYNAHPVRVQGRDQMALKVPQQVAQTQARGAPPCNSQPRQTIVWSLEQRREKKSDLGGLGQPAVICTLHPTRSWNYKGHVLFCLLARCPVVHHSPPPLCSHCLPACYSSAGSLSGQPLITVWRGSKEDVPHRQGGEEGTAFPPQSPGATFHQLNGPNSLHTPPPTQLSSQGGDALRKGSDKSF